MSFLPALGSFHVCLFLALSGLHSASQAQVLDCDVDGKSVSPNNGNTTAGVTGIMRCVDRETRQMAREQELRNGKFFGLNRFYEKGQLTREYTSNEKGNRDGRSRTFGSDGTLLSDEFYKNGSNLGLQKRFFPNGKLQRLTFYEEKPSDNPVHIRTEDRASVEFNQNGRLRDLRCADKPLIRVDAVDDQKLCGFAGVSVVEFFSGETLSARHRILNGKALEQEAYWPDGKLRYSAQWQADRLSETAYFKTGTAQKQIWFKLEQGRRIRELEKEFHENGAQINEKRWQDGRLNFEQTWYLNGQIKSNDQHLPDQKQTLSRRFHDTGAMAEEGVFIKERYGHRPIGAHRFFDQQGRLRGESHYDERGKITRERRLDETGTVISDDAVFEDGSRRAFSK